MRLQLVDHIPHGFVLNHAPHVSFLDRTRPICQNELTSSISSPGGDPARDSSRNEALGMARSDETTRGGGGGEGRGKEQESALVELIYPRV